MKSWKTKCKIILYKIASKIKLYINNIKDTGTFPRYLEIKYHSSIKFMIKG